MIELFYSNTPNGKKISIMLEEIELSYKITDQKTGDVLVEIEYPLGYVHGANDILAPNIFNLFTIARPTKPLQPVTKQNLFFKLIIFIIFDLDMTLVDTSSVFQLRSKRKWSQVYNSLDTRDTELHLSLIHI